MGIFYCYEEPGSEKIYISKERIMKEFFPSWSEKMRKIGKEDQISEKNCIEDFCIVHYAYPVGTVKNVNET